MCTVRAHDETPVIRYACGVGARPQAPCGCDFKSSSIDARCAVVGVDSRQRERAGAVFGQGSRAADNSREDLVTVGAKQEVAFVDDISRVVAASELARGRDFQSAGVDGGCSRVCVVIGQRKRATAVFGEAKGVGGIQHAGESDVVTIGVDQDGTGAVFDSRR